jgi:hypothetical protein
VIPFHEITGAYPKIMRFIVFLTPVCVRRWWERRRYKREKVEVVRGRGENKEGYKRVKEALKASKHHYLPCR